MKKYFFAYFFILALICIGTLIGCQKTDMGESSLPTLIPSDEIHYTTSDGKILELSSFVSKRESFGEGVAIVSNIYENGKGIIKLNAPAKTIGTEVFYTKRLTSIIIPGSVTSIGAWAFYGCVSLTSITIPGSVTLIGDGVFCGCTSLTNMYFQPTTPPDSLLYAFGNIIAGELDILKSLQAIYVPKGSAELYKQALWDEYEDLIQEYDFS